MPYTIVRNDLLKVEVDAIVLPSNSQLIIDGGVGALVASRSDSKKLRAALDKLAPCPVGRAVTTLSFARNAKYYIHAVGPVWQGGTNGEEAHLTNTYRSIFAEVIQNQCSSVAMPLISAGTFGYPVEQAFDIAVQEIRAFIDCHDDIDVTLVVYDSEAFAVAAKRFEGIRSYIEHAYSPEEERAYRGAPASFADYSVASSPRVSAESCADFATQSYVPSNSEVGSVAAPRAAAKKRRSILPSLPDFDGALLRKKRSEKEPSSDAVPRAKMVDAAPYVKMVDAAPRAKTADQVLETWTCACGSVNDGYFCPLCGRPKEKDVSANLESWISSLDEGFSVTLCKLIDKKNLTDPEVYKRANISRQLFSKIRSNPDYQPKKATAVALCIALELSLAETQDLLRRAGLALSNANLFDVIVQYYIEHGIYDYFEINAALFSFDCPLLGAK